MKQRIAIVGAGPSGLAAAKAVMECGCEPIVFEGSGSLGGIWRKRLGFVWPGMRTNVSKWTCAFSDFPWPENAEDFPLGESVEQYLRRYSRVFGVDDQIRYQQRVVMVAPTSDGWIVQASSALEEFNGVIIASGVFARPFLPKFSGQLSFKGKVSHAGSYREPGPGGRRVGVIGGSLTGIEIATHLSERGVEVVLFFDRAPWILPRYMKLADGKRAPFDLMLYRRSAPDAAKQPVSCAEQNRKRARYLEEKFGNPGDVHESLRVSVDDRPPYAVVSDNFLHNVKNGGITPIHEHVVSIEDNAVVTVSGKRVLVDEIILCTGYESDLSFLDREVAQKLKYDHSDQLLPQLAVKTVVHPDVKGLCLVGMYKGPFFSIMELQARWAAMIVTGRAIPPTGALGCDMVSQEQAIRELQPRPQFPHGDYVSFSDSIAREIGVLPPVSVMQDPTQPVTPFHYRMQGPFANPSVACAAAQAAYKRVSI